MKDNKFIAQPFVPKTETRIVLEVKEQSNFSKIAKYLGISTVYNCGDKPCACNNNSSLSLTTSSNSGSVSSSTPSEIASATKAAFDRVVSQYGGSSNATTSNDGSVTITYNSDSKKKD